MLRGHSNDMKAEGDERNVVLKRRRKARKKRGVSESGWGKRKGRRWRVLRNWLLLVCAIMAAVLLVGLLKVGSSKKETVSTAAGAGHGEESPEQRLKAVIEDADAVARAFLKETDPAKRLQWVCNAEEVKTRIGEYPEEARSAVGEIEKMLGHQEDGGRTLTGFVVKFSTGNVRLLEVVGTAEGPRVDWDAYARHGTASWEDLLSGKAKQAVVRVFCEPATERPEPFEDQGKWTCFRMSSPDLPQASLGFAAVGSVREGKMKQVILSAPKYRQRFTLEIVRHEGEDEPFFEITRCMAVGWIMGERDVEDEWAK